MRLHRGVGASKDTYPRPREYDRSSPFLLKSVVRLEMRIGALSLVGEEVILVALMLWVSRAAGEIGE
jgi:hypothetical protein